MVSLLSLTGCGTTGASSKQLERVAKDWCLAVRASQVLPVYPLTEDVEPGDVFLVQVPIEDQVSVYKNKGYLPLDNHLARLHPTGWDIFYSQRYGFDTSTVVPPKQWQFPTAPNTVYGQAPRASFPTYGFSVSRSEGLSAAFPISAIPIGLNLLDSASANGMVAIKDCYTYGLDIEELQLKAQQWRDEHVDFVKQFHRLPSTAKAGGQQFYLRIVHRVYLTKNISVSLFSNEAQSGAISAGLPKAIELFNLGKGTDAASAIDGVNAALQKNMSPTTQPSTQPAAAGAAGAPAVGGSVKVAMAAARSISLVESFDRPLVFGFIAFDLPIDEAGQLEPPVSTLAQLEGRKPQKGTQVLALKYKVDKNTGILRSWLHKDRENFRKMQSYLASKHIDANPSDVVDGAPYAELRANIVSQLSEIEKL